MNKRRLFNVIFCGQLAAIIFTWLDINRSRLAVGGGSSLVALGQLSGLIAGFFFLHQMIIISGTHFFEKHFGLDRLARIHHTNGLLGYAFLVAHVLLIIIGYATLANNRFIEQYFILTRSFPYVLLAGISVVLLDIVIVTSIFIVRKRLKYELWYGVHLLVYAAVLLALFHQIANGQTLLQSPLLKVYWLSLYVIAFSLVIWKRWASPLWLEQRHRLRVSKIINEAPGIISVYVDGRDMDKFKYEPGQFLLWQFWQRDCLGMHHPFTISSSPSENGLRLTVKSVGDFTKSINKLRVGTPVLISGPYGRFTASLQTRPKRLFIAGGIGITPIRSMILSATRPGDILLYAAQKETDLVFRDEFDALAAKGKIKAFYTLSSETKPGMANGYITEFLVMAAVSRPADYDVWLCGPLPMMDAVEKILLAMGFEQNQIHTERFRL